MAQRRMLSKRITNTDKFLDMPLSAQALYMHLNLSADDDGFVDNANMVMRMIGATKDDMRILLAKKFLINFNNGLVVIREWHVHNYIQKDRYQPTLYNDEFKRLTLASSGSYAMDTECIQDVSKLETQVRLGKSSLGEDSLVLVEDEKNETQTNDDNDHHEQKYEDPITLYRENAHPFIPNTLEQLIDWLKDFEQLTGSSNEANGIVALALHQALDAGTLKMQYIRTVLSSWFKAKVTTVEMAQTKIDEHKAQYGKPHGANSEPSKKTWLDEHSSMDSFDLDFGPATGGGEANG